MSTALLVTRDDVTIVMEVRDPAPPFLEREEYDLPPNYWTLSPATRLSPTRRQFMRTNSARGLPSLTIYEESP